MWGLMRRTRKSSWPVTAAALALLSLGVAAEPARAASAVVTDIRVAGQGQSTRVVLEFTKALSFRVFKLNDPYRVVIDMPEVGWRLPPKPLPVRTGLYNKLRYGLHKPGASRVVIDLTRPSKVTLARLLKPSSGRGHRLVIDLQATTRSAFIKTLKVSEILIRADSAMALAAPSAAPLKRAAKPTAETARFNLAPRKPALRQERQRYVIALDPGHGGADPGTISVSGAYEKHITLAMARAIRVELEKTGRFRVMMTRDRDIFIRLRDRIARAREAGADLFISLHADSIANSAISGPSVYTLSEKASDQEAAALAEKENRADLIVGMDLSNESREVTNILIDLAQRESMNQSARFAEVLIRELKRRTKVLRNTHRFAGFAVLKAPDIPSVLVELGFLSNKRDEWALRNGGYRRKLATGFAGSIAGYFARVEEAQTR